MNPYSIKKIINKKVTPCVSNGLLPVKTGHLPIYCFQGRAFTIYLTRINTIAMRHREYYRLHEREHHPRVSAGLFFITLGLALLVATNDLLNLGSVSAYFTWQTAMIFIGVILLLNLHFAGGLLLIAGGIWFLQDKLFVITPEVFKTFYWPAVIVLAGLTLIISSFFRRKS